MGHRGRNKPNRSSNQRGRGGRIRHTRRRDRNAKNQEAGEHVPYESYEVTLENKVFEQYYQAQNILGEDEWETFMSVNRTPLPVAFRITGSRSHAQDLREYMRQTYFPRLQGFEIDGEPVNPPTAVPWYPDSLAFVFNCGRSFLRRSPHVAEFHRFLVAETEVGNISRQEIVSMIPVLFLDVKKGMYVLDTCAAPGSKTSQLLELVHSDAPNPGTQEPDVPTGLVVANDANYARSQMLVHQAKRLQSPCLLVTNHDAQSFPRIFLTDRESPEGRTMLQFDRVLCDVPCSGDGTLRKNKAVWGTWAPTNGNNLHRLQKSILLRACEMVRVGGRIVYSTCSFNPVENEAVVASVINETGGAIRIVNVSDQVKELKRKPGLASWRVMSQSTTLYDTFDSSNADQKGLHESMFPPANAAELGLEHAMRVYPFLENCGGFFVVVLEKIEMYGSIDRFVEKDLAEKVNQDAEETAEAVKEAVDEVVEESAEVETAVAEEVADETAQENQDQVDRPTKRPRVDQKERTVRRGWAGVGECPFICLEPSNLTIESICSFYDVSPAFPRDQFVVRTENQVQDFQSIYFVSPPIKKILLASNADRLRIVNTGVKVFKRNGGDQVVACPYRVSSEGVQTISPFLSPTRQITVPVSDLVVFIKNEYPKFDEFCQETRDKLMQLPMGSCLLRCEPAREDGYAGSVTTVLVVPFFRAHVSVSLLLNKKERRSLLHRLNGEDIEDFTPLQRDAKGQDENASGEPDDANQDNQPEEDAAQDD